MRAKQATLHELNTIYNLEEMHDILEVIEVGNYNQRVAEKHYEAVAERKRRENADGH